MYKVHSRNEKDCFKNRAHIFFKSVLIEKKLVFQRQCIVTAATNVDFEKLDIVMS